MIKSVRMNKKELEILEKLSKHLECDESKVIKKALHQMYEDIEDLEFIAEYEKKLENNEIDFVKSEDVEKFLESAE